MYREPLKIERIERRLFLCLFFCLIHVSTSVLYSDQFVIQMNGGTLAALQFAEEHGFNLLGKVFDDHYHMIHKRIAKRSLQSSASHHKLLTEDSRVKSFSQQIIKRRTKRDSTNIATPLNDPKWPEMWYLNRGQGLDMNVQAAWKAGATGKDIVVTILDDGLEKDHPDIIQNYDANASCDINSRDADPQPRYDLLDSNRHGTRCAGEVAASANNSLCSVGIAYEARVGGIRMLDGDVTDAVEARSLSLNPQHIDIYSVSWGPDDDGKTVDGPGDLATRAFREGIEKGRANLGSIFVWASGNGGREQDNCNCDGYTNAIWTLSISSATENGLVPWYSEACSSTLATTYSSGSSGEKQIVTTDLHHGCTSSHTGTSASAPLAAGICALTLEVNKQLTWRDMQHIVVRTANPANLFAKDWATNGVRRNVSHSFGYGMMDAGAMVKLARFWNTVPPQKMCEIRAHHMDKPIFPKNKVELSLDVHCENVLFLEHVQAKITLSATRRGDIHIYLTSPLGTKSTLLAQRPADSQRSGFQAWPFMTVHCWGENPNGKWKLEVHNEGRYLGRASLKDWSLILYGTSENPDLVQNCSDSFKLATSTAQHSFSDDKLNEVAKLTDLSFEHNYVEGNSLKNEGLRGRKVKENVPQVSEISNDSDKKNALGSKKQKNGCVFVSPAGTCLDCQPGLYLIDGQCFKKCPEGRFIMFNSTMNEQCVHCHYTCRHCSGPNDYQCTSCYGDSQLDKDMYCRPTELILELQSFAAKDKAMIVAFIVLFVIILCMSCAVISTRHPRIFSCCQGDNAYSYHLAAQPRMTMSIKEKRLPCHQDYNSDED